MNSEKPSCFVIMPFSVRDHDIEKYDGDSNHWNEVYEGLIEPAVEAAGMRVERDDKDFSSRLVVEGIWKKIEASDVVLCDLSSLNPNVYLELGWALRADKKFVLIKDEHTDFSFDLNQFHTCVYSSLLKPSSLKADVRTLSQAIKETVGDEDRQYSMVKRMALTTAIELDAGSDKQADMLELIYKQLDKLSANKETQRVQEDFNNYDRESARIDFQLKRERTRLEKAEFEYQLESAPMEKVRKSILSSKMTLENIQNVNDLDAEQDQYVFALLGKAEDLLDRTMN